MSNETYVATVKALRAAATIIRAAPTPEENKAEASQQRQAAEKEIASRLGGVLKNGQIWMTGRLDMLPAEMKKIGFNTRRGHPGVAAFSRKKVFVVAKPVGRNAPKRLQKYNYFIEVRIDPKLA